MNRWHALPPRSRHLEPLFENRLMTESLPACIAILGSTGSIGSGLARQLVAAGQSVLLVGRNHEKLLQLTEQLGQPQLCLSALDSESLERELSESLEQNGLKLTGIANCVGSILLKAAHHTSDEEFRQTLDTNLFSAFACVKAAGRLMRRSGGSVVLVASAAAEVGIARHEAVAAAKAGVIGLARSAAATYANCRIGSMWSVPVWSRPS